MVKYNDVSTISVSVAFYGESEMSQDNNIKLGDLLDALEKELLASSFRVETIELELQLTAKKENDTVKVYVSDSVPETALDGTHVLKVKITGDTGGPRGSGYNPNEDEDSSDWSDASDPALAGSSDPTGDPGDPRGS
jgi:hypothetical protein